MTIEEKIKLIIDNADSCSYRLDMVLKRISDPAATLSGGLLEWLRGIGVDDPRIAPALDQSLSPEARVAMFQSLINRYNLPRAGVAKMLGCSVATISCYRDGRLTIPIKRLIVLQRIIAAIDAAVHGDAMRE